ncbi:hypothetical protein ACTI_60120 [Actinoplanes sp. OR16]|uniref:hypothetical protein n=1 Tax=Actinoplanes sp. OR16 TaxID=946334 RepID=UPI000F6E4B55|nr:hypothetical protein [Actinoplanes sp. OR16]BBH69327.1 hypothetical protein ACTI_60120 [Actinoplanes sp. OR16]
MPTGWLGLDWGNVPSWVGSLLTGSSLGLAAVTYYRSGGDRRRQLDETERSGAARVTLWWVNPRKALVRNSNDVAVTVQAIIREDAGKDERSEVLGLGPGETRGLLLSADREGKAGAVAVAIVDSYGRSWIRHADGRLDRVTSGSSDSTPGPGSATGLRWEPR